MYTLFFILFSSPFFALAVTSAKIEKPKLIDLSTQESKVEFVAVGKPSLIKINGTGGKLKGTLTIHDSKVDLEAIVPIASLTTGIELRDDHMKTKYLESGKYPDAKLVISDLKMEKNYFTEKFSQKNVPFKGKLSLHGQESDVEGFADIESDESSVAIIAKTKTNITSHKIDLPTYLGIKIADEVVITTELKIKKQ